MPGADSMPGPSTASVSKLLAKWEAGDPEALQVLVSQIYNELRRLAHYYLREERPNHTLQTTALVHKAYVRLAEKGPAHFENRCHFMSVSALLIRQILMQYARARHAAKRHCEYRLTLEDATSLSRNRGVDLIGLDDALNGLARVDARQSQIVELRFFGGLSIEETAEVLD